MVRDFLDFAIKTIYQYMSSLKNQLQSKEEAIVGGVSFPSS